MMPLTWNGLGACSAIPSKLHYAYNKLFPTLLIGARVTSSVLTPKQIWGEGLIVLSMGQSQNKWLPIALKIDDKIIILANT